MVIILSTSLGCHGSLLLREKLFITHIYSVSSYWYSPFPFSTLSPFFIVIFHGVYSAVENLSLMDVFLPNFFGTGTSISQRKSGLPCWLFGMGIHIIHSSQFTSGSSSANILTVSPCPTCIDLIKIIFTQQVRIQDFCKGAMRICWLRCAESHLWGKFGTSAQRLNYPKMRKREKPLCWLCLYRSGPSANIT